MEEPTPDYLNPYYKSTCTLDIPGEPLVVREKLVQDIWNKQDFRKKALQTDCKKPLTILDTGKSNPHEGPDFKNATINIDGKKIHGDIEIHLTPNLWNQHRHQCNVNFNNVVLHVCLFPNKSNPQPKAVTAKRQCPHTLILLPYLNHPLIEYTQHTSVIEDSYYPNSDINTRDQFLARIQNFALHRYHYKKGVAAKRLKKYGFEEAFHQLALEGLGYKRNRMAMANLALEHSQKSFKRLSGEELYNTQKNAWMTCGIRPANHPKKRIKQYKQLIDANPHWTKQCLELFTTLPFKSKDDLSTCNYRNVSGMKKLFSDLNEGIFKNFVGSTRMRTLAVDAVIPLVSAKLKRDFSQTWFHWPPGDFPSTVKDALSRFNFPEKDWPLSNGLVQGVLHESNLLDN